MSLTEIVVEFHKLYATTKKPEYREILKNLAGLKETPSFEEIWERRVNAGCERNNLPRIYAPQQP